jgi:hypothetical protein
MSEEKYLKKVNRLIRLFSGLIIFGLFLIPAYLTFPNLFDFSQKEEVTITTSIEVESIVELDEDRIENGIHVRTGFVDAEGLMIVVGNCTSCHSSKIILQNRMDTEGWNTTIKWMQETQNLWELGKNQEVIVNYLVTNYPLKAKGRRENLKNIEWYEIED